MKKIGIVVEYNPFHNGHLYQIQKIKEKFGKDCFISVVMSGDFVQRGEVSFLNKWEKTKIALENEVDLVVELPVYYAIQNAEIFSKMAVKILDYLGMEIQVFGAENDEIKIFEEIIFVDFEHLRLPAPKNYDFILKQYYGNYMQLPPEEERGFGHEFDVYLIENK